MKADITFMGMNSELLPCFSGSFVQLIPITFNKVLLNFTFLMIFFNVEILNFRENVNSV